LERPTLKPASIEEVEGDGPGFISVCGEIMRKQWWERSLDHQLRAVEGTSTKKRDPEELRKNIAVRIKELREENKEYHIKFQRDVKRISEGLDRTERL